MSWWINVEPREQTAETFEGNLTYNVGLMLRRAGIHPHILEGQMVKVVRPVIENAYMTMFENPDYFRQFEASNGWGTYESTMKFVSNLNVYLASAPDDYVMRWH